MNEPPSSFWSGQCASRKFRKHSTWIASNPIGEFGKEPNDCIQTHYAMPVSTGTAIPTRFSTAMEQIDLDRPGRHSDSPSQFFALRVYPSWSTSLVQSTPPVGGVCLVAGARCPLFWPRNKRDGFHLIMDRGHKWKATGRRGSWENSHLGVGW